MRLFIDCDPGIDDALAIALAYSSRDMEVAAISTGCGNVGVDQSTRNLIKTVSLLQVEAHPLIGKGSRRPLKRNPVTARGVHGKDGLADLGIPTPLFRPRIFDGVELLIETLSRQDIDSVVALGPLTNLAKAIDKEPGITRRIRRLVVMGGAVRVSGNITPHAEFNFYVDPEAAAFVLSKHLPLTLVSLDATQSFVFGKKDIAPLSGYKSELGRFIYSLISYSIMSHRKRFNLKGAYMHDPLAMAAAIDPSIGKFESAAIAVDCAKRRGAVIHKNGKPNVKMLVAPRVGHFKTVFVGNIKNRIEAYL